MKFCGMHLNNKINHLVEYRFKPGSPLDHLCNLSSRKRFWYTLETLLPVTLDPTFPLFSLFIGVHSAEKSLNLASEYLSIVWCRKAEEGGNPFFSRIRTRKQIMKQDTR